jgi:transcriptional regulator with XRE-family HTH domain
MNLTKLSDKELCLYVRTKLDCSQGDLAEVMMMTQPNVSHVETGRQGLKPLARRALVRWFEAKRKRQLARR